MVRWKGHHRTPENRILATATLKLYDQTYCNDKIV